MTMVKNFGLGGVASTVQLGKGGASLGSEVDTELAKGVVSATDVAGELTNVRAADPVKEHDVVTKGWANGGNIVMGEAGDGDYVPGAVEITPETPVSTAVDSMNEILSKLIPAQPKAFPGGESLTIAGATQALLASGAVPDNTAGGVLPAVAGQAVARTISNSVATGVVGASDNVGPGNEGSLELKVNGVKVDEQAFADGAQNKTTGKLRIANDQAYPLATPGFWESFRSSAAGVDILAGWNRISLAHTKANATPDAFVVVEPNTQPAVSAVTLTEVAAGTLAPSSGIPHYGADAQVGVSFTADNLALETYLSAGILGVSGGVMTATSYKAGEAGLPAILPRNMATHAANFTVAINGAASAASQLTVTAKNAVGSATSISATRVLLNKSGSKISEMGIPVTIAANGGPAVTTASRVENTGGDFPAEDKSALTVGDWNSAAAAESFDAAVVGGVLQHDVTNYSTGYLPAGPDRSSFDADQYVTFAFRRTAVSKFNIEVVGSYDKIYVKLPGLTEANTTTSAGWLNMGVLYGGAGFAGDRNGANGSLGCALGAVASGSGSWTCTFGTLSTTNAANNLVLVRFKLKAGQSITSLKFVPPTR